MEEKTERNTQIFLLKYGFKDENDAKERKTTLEPVTYRKLSVQFGLSVTRLQEIVNAGKRKFII